MDNLKRLIGKKIKSIRKNAGFPTQQALADAMGIDQPRIAKWESGTSVPDPKHRKLLCETLGVNEAELFTLEESAPEVSGDSLRALIALLPTLKDHQIGDLLLLATKFAASNKPASGSKAN